MSQDDTVVIHPAYGGSVDPSALASCLQSSPGVTTVLPEDAQGVADKLAAGAAVLITYEWRNDYLSPSLRWVQGEGVGVDQYPIDEFRRRGVVLTNAADMQSSAMAEHAFGLLLAMTREIATSTRAASGQVWSAMAPREIAGMTLGILGMGSVGAAIAQRAVGWGLTVIGTRRHPEKYVGRDATVYGADQLRAVCGASDIIISCLPGGTETRHAIGSAELEALGAGWLVNIGRGSVIDERALVAALQTGALRGAALDVFETEPLPAASPLWRMDNVVITPHCAGYTQHHRRRLVRLFQRNLRALRGEGPWVNRIV